MRQQPSATLIARIKRNAKRLTKAVAMTHSDALEVGAGEAGYTSWHALLAAHAAAVDGDFRVDPVLPPDFDTTPNEERSAAEIARWWDRPFAVSKPDGSYTVYALDGGAWDRPTSYGNAATLDDAKRLAAEKLEAWQRLRARPSVMVDGADAEYPLAIVRQPQHPHEDSTVLGRFRSAEELNAALQLMLAES